MTRYDRHNLDYFESIDTSEKAYWLGFIAADGNVNKAQQVVTVAVHRKDREHLEKLAAIFNLPIREYRCGHAKSPICFLRICSVQVANSLVALGVRPQKSLYEDGSVIDNVPPILLRHFIRGLIDGDGWIGLVKVKRRNYLRLTITGHWKLLDRVSKIVSGRLGVRCLFHRMSGDHAHLYWCRRESVLQVYRWLFDPQTVYLQRKWDLLAIESDNKIKPGTRSPKSLRV